MSLKNVFGKWKKPKKTQQAKIINRADRGDTLSGRLAEDEDTVFQGLGGSVDIVRRKVLVAGTPAVLIYIEGIVDTDVIQKEVLAKLQQATEIPRPGTAALQYIAEKVLSAQTAAVACAISDILAEVLLGKSVLLLADCRCALLIGTKGGTRRAIQEPPTERTVRGSREGFIEDIAVNMAIIRRKLKSPNLIMEAALLGRRSRTKVVITYLSDVADPKLVQEVRRRISQIDIDAVLGSGYLEKHFEDRPYSLFPQTYGTERPDKVVANMLEGRVAILVDGTPYTLVVPAVFIQFMQGAEDYYERTIVGSVARLVRYLAFVITTTLTAIYIALITYNHSLLPSDLLLAVAKEREELPFTPLVEAMFMEMVIEILREAALRLPSTVGQSLGVVGGIVIGQAVISAKLVSPLIVVMVSLATISSFVFPSYSMALAIRLIKFPLIFLAAVFGALGIAVGWLVLIIHLVSLESFGVPYLAPLAPTRYADLGDTLVVSRIWQHKKRPVTFNTADKQRISDSPQEHRHEQ
ncbi:spore germination protein [Desulforamulus hydrothermalis]|uniref:Uncharacterized membrane protein yfkQ n=1 Tax=Desulforamulus hydrothermalis Lam5 = DSM 18033 TaxID=1121428 RepID=K8EF10_9FIRM|nr:spore germination protein [Desulforamulus hydrothermalis]CCO07311.1 Uncharacterized membrane protein yfkQ [Desulforamulus hydrothermalis Lam5 = DSM 18033]SHG93791.1 spore germination protein KA [Desulforamulus hydrothermalis Lam5 = DSM 18033]